MCHLVLSRFFFHFFSQTVALSSDEDSSVRDVSPNSSAAKSDSGNGKPPPSSAIAAEMSSYPAMSEFLARSESGDEVLPAASSSAIDKPMADAVDSSQNEPPSSPDSNSLPGLNWFRVFSCQSSVYFLLFFKKKKWRNHPVYRIHRWKNPATLSWLRMRQTRTTTLALTPTRNGQCTRTRYLPSLNFRLKSFSRPSP